MAFVAELPDRCGAVGGSASRAFSWATHVSTPPLSLGVAAQTPTLAVLSPRSETDLQAEAMLEFAIELSDSLAGVIVIAECSGAEPLEVGHGGSAIIVLGEVVAEALSDDDVLIAEVPTPFPQPSPREPLPAVPPLLAQRFDLHSGRLSVEHGPDLS